MDIKLYLDIIQGLSVTVVSFVAIYGISSWRREAKWKRKYELAEEVLSCFYEISDSFDIIRSQAGNSGEGKSRKRNERETPEESEILDSAYVIVERFEKEKAPFIKLRSMKYRFMALFGESAGEPFNEIDKLTRRLFIASQRLGNRYWKDQGRKNFTEKQFERHLAEMNKYEEIFWANYGEIDKFKNEVNDVVKKIENICQRIIEKK
jgi:hypothetical protein